MEIEFGGGFDPHLLQMKLYWVTQSVGSVKSIESNTEYWYYESPLSSHLL